MNIPHFGMIRFKFLNKYEKEFIDPKIACCKIDQGYLYFYLFWLKRIFII